MNKKRARDIFAIVLLVVSILMIGGALVVNHAPLDTDSAALSLGKSIEKRVSTLESFMQEALEGDGSEWMSIPNLPGDMVVYRYYGDTLRSWVHQFPLQNDMIGGVYMIPRFGSSRLPYVSPLADVTEELSYVNYGPKWYLVKKAVDGEKTVIGGLEMVNGAEGPTSSGRVNPRLGLGSRFSLQPLSASVGSSVLVREAPLLKVTSESTGRVSIVSDYVLLFAGILLFILATLVFLSRKRTWTRYLVSMILQTVLLIGVYFYGFYMRNDIQLFSPLLYADGPVLYSLGAVLIINTFLTLIVIDTYFARWTILHSLKERRTSFRMAVSGIVNMALGVFIIVFIVTTFRSIILNSGICLELYKIPLLSVYTAVVYLSYFILAVTLLLLLQMLSPAVRYFFNFRYDSFSNTGRVLFSIVAALYFVIASSYYGFQKEKSRVEVWANRISMERDIALEIQLRAVENAIAADRVISALSVIEGSSEIIHNRITDLYMSRLTKDYDITVVNLGPETEGRQITPLERDRFFGASPIVENLPTHFYYDTDMNGRTRYSGKYVFNDPKYGLNSILVLVEAKSNREDRGYLSLLGISEPGKVSIPQNYSYAKYTSDKLVMSKGEYPYPTVIPEEMKGLLSSGKTSASLVRSGYSHFIHNISDETEVIVSRARVSIVSYIVEVMLLALLSFFLISIITMRDRRLQVHERTYFKDRINAVLYISLILTLVAMALFSVWFVYDRNETDVNAILSSKINSIQSMVQGRVRQASSVEEIDNQGVMGSIENIANTLKSDITLYTPEGLMFMTTTPDIFERMILGRRINEDAYYNIVYGHKRYYIHRETLSSHRFYSLYASVFGSDGEMLAIVSSPYTDRNYDLGTEAVIHVATIITVFLLLLILARIITSAVISRMFHPLSEMSRKMNVTDVDHLDFVEYDRDDEISSLVSAYNRMVQDLSDSTKQLAQAERDKAWSEMARQVAHEIKNPLTPIKLQLQMLIRMKESGNPKWEKKFDEVSRIVLEHIDILADTANEFSTFAKLYSEEPVRFNLDALIRDEVLMFAAEEGVKVSYIGLTGAMAEGPKPQITRVIVNLITNSVQAIQDSGISDGKVLVSLRNSSRDGFYEIAVDDNGPGVAKENLDKLFTPKFTTKSSGSGLGLAISRTVIERCRGEIRYSKSFSLGGACFTIYYPKSK